MEEQKQKIGIGYRFGKLTVVSDTGNRKDRHIIWNCVCDCGGSIELCARTIRRGTVTDCGCGTREKQKIKIGYRFGKLTVASDTGKRKGTSIVWLCTCDCGGSIELDGRAIRCGNYTDCGCGIKGKQKIKIGYRFGKLTVTADTGKRNGSSIVWLCVCDCGGSIELPTDAIRRGTYHDCGCETKVNPRGKDLTGQRFGKLVVLAPTEKRMDSGSIVWKCKCDCGKEAEVPARRLVRGQVRSCGCLSNPPRKPYIGKRFGRLTVIDYAGTAKELGKTGKQNYWKCVCDCGKETIVGQTELQTGETQSCGCLHKDRMLESLKVIDGTSVVILESTRKGLRSNNTSGYTGVFHSPNGKWEAYITFKKKRYWLGRYDKFEDAVKARQKGEEMHDEFLDWYYSTCEQNKKQENTL